MFPSGRLGRLKIDMELRRSVAGAGRNNPSSGREGRGEPLAREEDDAVETLVSDGSHAAFRVGVGIGGLAGRSGGSCSGMTIAATTRPPAFWKSLVQGGLWIVAERVAVRLTLTVPPARAAL